MDWANRNQKQLRFEIWRGLYKMFEGMCRKTRSPISLVTYVRFTDPYISLIALVGRSGN